MACEIFPTDRAGAPNPGRFFYCDTTLFRNLGHFANSCRHLTGEARQRGLETLVFGHVKMEAGLRRELAATPLFRHTSWYTGVADPLCGPLEAFFLVAEAIAQDLDVIRQACRPGARDTIYWNSARASELMGVINWLQGNFTPATCPRVVMEFGTNSGAKAVRDATGQLRFEVRSPEPSLYRFAARRLRPDFRDRLVFAAFDEAAAADYRAVLDSPTTVLPLPQAQDRPVRQRPPGHRPRVAFLGHQRPDKGYHLVPGLVRDLLARHRDLEILVHNGAPGEMARETDELGAIADGETRLHLAMFPADGAAWRQLLELSDLIVLPYQPDRFADAYSAILSEACAQGIPVVAPDGTTLSATLARFGGGGTVFAGWTVAAVAEAVDRAVADFDALGDRARAGAMLWRRVHGAGSALDAILGRPDAAEALKCAS